MPEGLFQLLVATPETTPTYMYSKEAKSLDYFPAGIRASGVFDRPVTLAILSFGVVNDELKLATTTSKASRSQKDMVPIKYRDVTLFDIEQALLAMDTMTEG